MTDQNLATSQVTIEDLDRLGSQLQSESEKNQRQIVAQLATAGDRGLGILMEFLQSRRDNPIDLAIAKAYQCLYQANTPLTQTFLQTYFPNGIVPLNSDRNIDYRPLQQSLLDRDFQTADTLTRQKLCELAGEAAIQRKWVYFTEVEQFPVTDLKTVDTLWWVHSEGNFGFSVQRQMWLSLGKDFTKLWFKIGWKNGNNWTQYPNGFTWDLSAPQGHLPLLNQLRGVRVAASLFSHPVWSK